MRINKKPQQHNNPSLKLTSLEMALKNFKTQQREFRSLKILENNRKDAGSEGEIPDRNNCFMS